MQENNLKIKFKKLIENAVIPSYAKIGDAGLDLTAISKEITDKYVEYDTGLAIEIPYGYVGLIFPRSSNSKKDLLLCNSVGCVDSGYRGSIKLRFKPITNHSRANGIYGPTKNPFINHNNVYESYEVGEKVGQLVIMPYPQIEPIEVDELSSTERGDGGFGHTGK